MKTLKEKLLENIYFNSKDILKCSRDCGYLQNVEGLTNLKCDLFFEKVSHEFMRCGSCIEFLNVTMEPKK